MFGLYVLQDSWRIFRIDCTLVVVLFHFFFILERIQLKEPVRKEYSIFLVHCGLQLKGGYL